MSQAADAAAIGRTIGGPGTAFSVVSAHGRHGSLGLPGRRAAQATTSALALAALIALLLGASGRPVQLAARPLPTPAHRGFSSLPLAARGALSRGLGGDDHRYWGRQSSPGEISTDNPAQRLQASFSDGDVAVSNARGLRLGLSSLAVGRGAALEPLGALADTSVSRNQVTFSTAGVREAFVNGPWGVEQSFTIARRAAGAGLLRISEAVSSNAVGRVSAHGHGVTFTSSHGELRYQELSVTDARGRSVAAHLSVAGKRLTISVADAHAAYPLHVDPTFQQSAELTPSDGGGQLGFSIAASGRTIVAGAPRREENEGAAYVYEEPASGGWADATQTAKLSITGGEEGDRFGYSVAMSGTTIVVGAPGRHAKGAAYVYTAPATGGWIDATQTAELTASNGEANDEFGTSVGASEGTIVVGAVGRNVSQGSAYVYTMPSTGGWADATETAELTASDGAQEDQFGSAVAISTSTIVVSAYDHTVNSHLQQGALYVFTRPAAGPWVNATQTAELIASDGEEHDNLGLSLAVSGPTIVAGAPAFNGGQGVVYEWTVPSAGGWVDASQTAELVASDGTGGDNLGEAVSVSGATVVAGAPNREANGEDEAGAVYEFNEPAGGWVNENEAAEFNASNGEEEDQLGSALALSGTTIVTGVRNANGGDGAGYTFTAARAAVSSSSVSLSLSPSSIAANGSSSSTATFAVEDTNGNPVAGDDVTISSAGAQAVGPVSEGTVAGTYQATITSTTEPGSTTITGSDHSGTSEASASAALVQTGSSASNEPASAPAGSANTPTSLTAMPTAVHSAPAVCKSTRTESIHWKTGSGVHLKRIVITINGRSYRTLSGSARQASVSLHGWGVGKVVVKILATSRSGRRYSTKRTYRPCVPLGANRKPKTQYLSPS